MSHSLTQHEEIDHVLRAMVNHDMEVDTPIPNGVQSGRAIRDGKRDEYAVVASFPYGVVHNNSASGF